MEYSNNTISELRTICKERNIKGVTNKNKNGLIEMIQENDNAASVSKQTIDAIPDDALENKSSPVSVIPSVQRIAKTRTKVGIKTISREDAEKSADEWLGPGESLMRTWLVNAFMDTKQHRDIGKVLAYVVEIHVNTWLTEKTGRPVKNVVGEPYDGKTDDDKPSVRNQIKFRMDAWHFETTRRNSKKNAETNSTGHVAYKKDEFDMLAIFKPGPTFGITGSTIRCIPASVLVNPMKPDQLITTINANIRKIYDCDEKTDEVIKLLY